jgi:hypothetical protein
MAGVRAVPYVFLAAASRSSLVGAPSFAAAVPLPASCAFSIRLARSPMRRHVRNCALLEPSDQSLPRRDSAHNHNSSRMGSAAGHG